MDICPDKKFRFVMATNVTLFTGKIIHMSSITEKFKLYYSNIYTFTLIYKRLTIKFPIYKISNSKK